MVPKEYGELRPSTSIDGAEFLEEKPPGEGEEKPTEEEGTKTSQSCCYPNMFAISAAWFVDDKANGEPVLISVEGEDEGDRNSDSEAEEMGEGEEGGKEEKKDGTSGSNEGGEQDEERDSKRRRIDTLRVHNIFFLNRYI